MIHTGKKVVFDLDDGKLDANGTMSCGSYIEDKATGKRTKMREEDRNFLIKMKVLPSRQMLETGPAEQLAPLVQAPATGVAVATWERQLAMPGASAATGYVAPFRRRAPWL